jgi:hypothetical protein
MVYPEGFAKRLPGNKHLIIQMHYTATGTATVDQTKFGFTFADEAPEHEVRTIGLSNTRFRIPPGDNNYPVSGEAEVPKDVRIMTMMAHMHVRGKAFRFEELRGNESKTLLDIPRYDFNWQLDYTAKEPILVKKGSTIKITGWFDNSDENPANPDPTKTVRWGDQTWEEMLLGYIDYYTVDGSPMAGFRSERKR